MIHIVGTIDSDMFKHVLSELSEQMQREPIEILLCSEGGDAEIGLAIASTLRAHPRGYNVHVVGQANSAAIAIVVAASHRSMDSMAWLMYHAAQLKLKGNAMVAVHDAKRHLADERMWADFMAKYSKLNAKQWLKLAERDSYFNAEQARAAGLIDEVRSVL